MSIAQAKAYILLALGELAKIDPNPVEPKPAEPKPQEPAPSTGPNADDTLGVHGQVVRYLPATIRCNLSQKCRIQAFSMAGGGGSKVSTEMAIDNGPFQMTSRLDKTNADVPVGAFTLYVKGGLAGVQYAINAIPE